MSISFGLEIPKPVYVLLKNCCYHIYYMVFVGSETTEAESTEATIVTTSMNFYSFLSTCLNYSNSAN